MGVEFSRDNLLMNYDSWGPVKKDLESMPDFFQVTPITISLMGCLARLNESVKKLYLLSLKSSAMQIRQLYDSANSEDGMVVIVESKITQPIPPRSIKLSIRHFRMDLVGSVENAIKAEGDRGNC